MSERSSADVCMNYLCIWSLDCQLGLLPLLLLFTSSVIYELCVVRNPLGIVLFNENCETFLNDSFGAVDLFRPEICPDRPHKVCADVGSWAPKCIKFDIIL